MAMKRSALQHSALQKRLYTVVASSPAPSSASHRTRQRANSASLHTVANNPLANPLAFFDSPQVPPPRLPSTHSKPPKQAEHNHNPLALTPTKAPIPDPNPLLLPAPTGPSIPLQPYVYPTHRTPPPAPAPAPHEAPPRPHYTLAVGAYGIPKRIRPPTHQPSSDPLHLATQVGEDAYFVRENALGVADGVGGWARDPCAAPTPTPSALFARRLMHFASKELEPVTTSTYPPTPYPATTEETEEQLQDQLDIELESLADGIDVLNILQSAYDATVRAHVHTATGDPVKEGSSTALLAVLDDRCTDVSTMATASAHPAPPTTTSPSRSPPLPTSATQNEIPPTSTSYSRPSASPDLEAPIDQLPLPLLHIAHLGDSMGMLVRGDEIVWRSEEMWWRWNCPVQLGMPVGEAEARITTTPKDDLSSSQPQGFVKGLFSSFGAFGVTSASSPHFAFECPPPALQSRNIPTCTDPDLTPRALARTYTLPVHPDDILILATDGLSDNLWDEDVLEEVKGVMKGCMGGPPSVVPPASAFASGEPPSSPDGSPRYAYAYPWRYPRGSSPSASTSSTTSPSWTTTPTPSSTPTSTLALELQLQIQKQALARTLAEALCSRARHVSERRGVGIGRGGGWANHHHQDLNGVLGSEWEVRMDGGRSDETPFARRAREAGRVFRGGKRDDISVLVAIVSPVPFAQ